mmetsp:Transcript_21223/g.43116  ORF Transcript_21223/g.43116 Transcript_21223/m.43116 type:complete len:246 (-) Transcript_21223:727-1464(-)
MPPGVTTISNRQRNPLPETDSTLHQQNLWQFVFANATLRLSGLLGVRGFFCFAARARWLSCTLTEVLLRSLALLRDAVRPFRVSDPDCESMHGTEGGRVKSLVPFQRLRVLREALDVLHAMVVDKVKHQAVQPRKRHVFWREIACEMECRVDVAEVHEHGGQLRQQQLEPNQHGVFFGVVHLDGWENVEVEQLLRHRVALRSHPRRHAEGVTEPHDAKGDVEAARVVENGGAPVELCHSPRRALP